MTRAQQQNDGSEKRKHAGAAGFTLLEVVVAVVILGLAYVAVLQNFSFSLRNILRVEESRGSTLASALAFEGMLQPVSEEGGELEEMEPGPVYLEGQTYNLMLVASDNGEFMSLKLTRP
jgi:prepilin-type N-terminal cleavage/methylation domain-containing protein